MAAWWPLVRPAIAIALATLLVPTAAAHGDLAVNELEVLAIRDFEGQEDSFPWEGFEIWDVYVGEGYNGTYDSDGVHVKANFAGDGTRRPSGGKAWTITVQFTVGEEAIERQITHDGSTVTTSFESLQWTIADGNVFQVKAWVPIADWTGKSVTDLVIVSAVDGEPRDTAPGGVHAPGSGAEVPVQGPGTPVFPPLGEGRLVDEVHLTGPGKFLNVTLARKDGRTFEVTVTNPLKEQGQHVSLQADPAAGWALNATSWGANLDAGASTTFDVTLEPPRSGGSEVRPLRVDLVSDIGGRRSYFAFLDNDQVQLVDDASLARTATLLDDAKGTPGLPLAAVLGAVVMALLISQRRSPRS